MGKVCDEFGIGLTDDQILVNIHTQRLHLIHLGKCVHSYAISTALNGAGQLEGTGKTPLGLHYVAKKIGDGANPFEVFVSRESTGAIAEPEEGGKAIVGRILWLQGAQPSFNQGFNQGKVVDSYARYIYIHGTNDLPRIGKPVSGGCVRMIPDEIVVLFKSVAEKTPVYIYQA